MKSYLAHSEIIDVLHPKIQELAQKLAQNAVDEVEIARECFLFVRDKIAHTGDIQSSKVSVKASEVLEAGTGWCYAKSHLLAALLRANGIPTGFCYQRLHCNEYKDGSYCLHGLNAIYLKKFGWYRVDARGNKEGVDAQFDPPHEQLAFVLEEGEAELEKIYEEPLENVVLLLKQEYDQMINNFPDL